MYKSNYFSANPICLTVHGLEQCHSKFRIIILMLSHLFNNKENAFPQRITVICNQFNVLKLTAIFAVHSSVLSVLSIQKRLTSLCQSIAWNTGKQESTCNCTAELMYKGAYEIQNEKFP